MKYVSDRGLGLNSAEVSGAAKATCFSLHLQCTNNYKIINGYYVTNLKKH